MRLLIRLSSMVALIALGSAPVTAAADEGMIMLSGECPYMVLDADQGQVLVKQISGSRPRTGDILTGKFDTQEFATLNNENTGEELKVWVDLVDTHGNRALSRHGRYCS